MTDFAHVILLVAVLGPGCSNSSRTTTTNYDAAPPIDTLPDAADPDQDQKPDVNPGPDSGTTSFACERYLACLLVATPEQYAAELLLYGDESTCWKSRQTAAGCTQACDVAFGELSDRCVCDGSSCSAPAGDTIYEINSGAIVEGTTVELSQVVISAVDDYGQYAGDIYVQEEKGGPGSGIELYRPERNDGGSLDDLKPGDRVRVSGVVEHFAPLGGFKPPKTHINAIAAGKITHLSTGDPPAAAIVTVADLEQPTIASDWEAVLVQVQDVRVTEAINEFGEFTVTGDLDIGDELYSADPAVGSCITLKGIWAYFYAYTLNPRSSADVISSTSCP